MAHLRGTSSTPKHQEPMRPMHEDSRGMLLGIHTTEICNYVKAEFATCFIHVQVRVSSDSDNHQA
jgi:hypothetical protein